MKKNQIGSIVIEQLERGHQLNCKDAVIEVPMVIGDYMLSALSSLSSILVQHVLHKNMEEFTIPVYVSRGRSIVLEYLNDAIYLKGFNGHYKNDECLTVEIIPMTIDEFYHVAFFIGRDSLKLMQKYYA